jgi:hypothetical protein
MASGIGAQKQAFVRALRNITALTTAIGSDGIHEGVVTRGVEYPFVVYSVSFSVRSDDWGHRSLMRTGFDVVVVTDDQVEAHNLDAAILNGLKDVIFDPLFDPGSGQSTLFFRRIADTSSVGRDGEGEKVYSVGGTYTLWTDQAL